MESNNTYVGVLWTTYVLQSVAFVGPTWKWKVSVVVLVVVCEICPVEEEIMAFFEI